MNPVRLRQFTLGGAAPLVLIAGPCVIESRDHALMMAQKLRELTNRLGLPFVFKASYDKANRSGVSSPRGPGLERGLEILSEIRRVVDVPVLSDIHTELQAAPAGAVLDLVQIPAFLCRQTDLLAAAAKTGKPVNVKKGQWMAPWDMKGVVEKLHHFGCREILLTERGSSFGYNRLVTDLRALSIMRSFGCPVVFDATHSAQLPGGLGEVSGGERQHVAALARGAVGAGVDALFLEVHDDPDHALSDGPNMLPLRELEPLLRQVMALDRAVREFAF